MNKPSVKTYVDRMLKKVDKGECIVQYNIEGKPAFRDSSGKLISQVCAASWGDLVQSRTGAILAITYTTNK